MKTDNTHDSVKTMPSDSIRRETHNENTISAPLNCSCPRCHKEITIEMICNDNENHVMDAITDIVGEELKITGSYTYMGEMTCPCGNDIVACLTVASKSA